MNFVMEIFSAKHSLSKRVTRVLSGVTIFMGITAVIGFAMGRLTVLTPDQKGYHFFEAEQFKEAALSFSSPVWQGTAYFRAGAFKEAAGIFAGYDTAEAAYNHGTSLVMLGKYDEAILRYERSLELNPGWSEAENNLKIARARAEMLKKVGGDMTGGKLEADEIVFTKGKSFPEGESEEVSTNTELGDAEMRAVWLRQVQTKPADFLRAKFAYQHARPTNVEQPKEPEEQSK